MSLCGGIRPGLLYTSDAADEEDSVELGWCPSSNEKRRMYSAKQRATQSSNVAAICVYNMMYSPHSGAIGYSPMGWTFVNINGSSVAE